MAPRRVVPMSAASPTSPTRQWRPGCGERDLNAVEARVGDDQCMFETLCERAPEMLESGLGVHQDRFAELERVRTALDLREDVEGAVRTGDRHAGHLVQGLDAEVAVLIPRPVAGHVLGQDHLLQFFCLFLQLKIDTLAGIQGGLPGSTARCIIDPGGENERLVTKANHLPIADRTVVRCYTAGGGGYGPPWKRPVSAVLEDVADGYVSREGARRHYGLRFAGDTLTVDEKATKAARAVMAEQGGVEQS